MEKGGDDMRELEFAVSGQRIEKMQGCDFGGLVAGTKGYLRARFMFDAAWKRCKIAASFFDASGHEEAMPVAEGACEIPESVLKRDVFYVSLTGMRNRYTITTNRLAIRQGRR